MIKLIKANKLTYFSSETGLTDTSLTDSSLIDIARNNQNLTSIDINCYDLTDNGIIGLVFYCKSLVNIKLRYCNVNITDNCLHEIGENCSNLKQFYMDGSYEDPYDIPNITDKGIITLGKKCAKLTHFHLINCVYVSDVGISSLAKYCPKLEEIEFSNIRDACFGIKYLVGGCPKLTRIKLSYCKVDNDFIKYLVDKCNRLTHISLEYVSNITKEDILLLIKGCPRLDNIKYILSKG